MNPVDHTHSRSRSRSRAVNTQPPNAGGESKVAALVQQWSARCETSETPEHRSRPQASSISEMSWYSSVSSNSPTENRSRRSRSRSRSRIHGSGNTGRVNQLQEMRGFFARMNPKSGNEPPETTTAASGGVGVGAVRVIPPSPMPSFYSVPRRLPVQNNSTPARSFSSVPSPSGAQNVTSATARKRTAAPPILSKSSRDDQPHFPKRFLEDGKGPEVGRGKASGESAIFSRFFDRKASNSSSQSPKPATPFKTSLDRSQNDLSDVEIIAVSSSDEDLVYSKNSCSKPENLDMDRGSPRVSIDNRPARRIPIIDRHKSSHGKQSPGWNNAKNASAVAVKDFQTSTSTLSQSRIDDEHRSFVDDLLKNESLTIVPVTANVCDTTGLGIASRSMSNEVVHHDAVDVIAAPGNSNSILPMLKIIKKEVLEDESDELHAGEDSNSIGIVDSDICSEDYGDIYQVSGLGSTQIQDNHVIPFVCAEENKSDSNKNECEKQEEAKTSADTIEVQTLPKTEKETGSDVLCDSNNPVRMEREDVDEDDLKTQNEHEEFHEAYEEIQDDEKKVVVTKKQKKRRWCSIA